MGLLPTARSSPQSLPHGDGKPNGQTIFHLGGPSQKLCGRPRLYVLAENIERQWLPIHDHPRTIVKHRVKLTVVRHSPLGT